MSNRTIFVTSLEYVPVPVRALVNGAPYDPTADVVEMAFIPTSQAYPVDSDWNAATWETSGVAAGTEYLAVCLVGPGAVELPAGVYSVFVRVTDSPEVPVVKADSCLSIV